MEKHSKNDLRRLNALLKDAHRLQARIYNLQSEFEDRGKNELAELCMEAGFEIDTTQTRLDSALKFYEYRSQNNEL